MTLGPYEPETPPILCACGAKAVVLDNDVPKCIACWKKVRR